MREQVHPTGRPPAAPNASTGVRPLKRPPMDGRLMRPIGSYLMIENGGHLAAHLHSSRRRNVLQFKVGVRFLRFGIHADIDPEGAAGGR
jgi:hypothetical protein